MDMDNTEYIEVLDTAFEAIMENMSINLDSYLRIAQFEIDLKKALKKELRNLTTH